MTAAAVATLSPGTLLPSTPTGLSLKRVMASAELPALVRVMLNVLGAPLAMIPGANTLPTASGERAVTLVTASLAGLRPWSLVKPTVGDAVCHRDIVIAAGVARLHRHIDAATGQRRQGRGRDPDARGGPPVSATTAPWLVTQLPVAAAPVGSMMAQRPRWPASGRKTGYPSGRHCCPDSAR